MTKNNGLYLASSHAEICCVAEAKKAVSVSYKTPSPRKHGVQEVQISLKMQVIFVSASHCAILSFTSPQSQRSLQLQTKEWKSASLHFCLEKANQTGAWDHACLGTSCQVAATA